MSELPTVIERAIAYAKSMDPAIQGSHGSDATFNVAVALVRGFALSEDTALEILADVHNPLCSPAWSERELRHKVKSAALRSTRPVGYLLADNEQRRRQWREKHRGNGAQAERLDLVSYHNIATELRTLCGDFTEVPDALPYLDSRCLIAAAATALVFALPPREQQGAIVSELAKTFELDSLVRAGLLWRDSKTAKVETRWFTYADHRLCIPWQSPDGQFDVLQRRKLSPGVRPYVFPPGMRPTYPFGAELLTTVGPATSVAWCEGALDVMSMRLIVRRDGLDILPLGLLLASIRIRTNLNSPRLRDGCPGPELNCFCG